MYRCKATDGAALVPNDAGVETDGRAAWRRMQLVLVVVFLVGEEDDDDNDDGDDE